MQCVCGCVYDRSRLGCQIIVTKNMDGWEVKVPAAMADARSWWWWRPFCLPLTLLLLPLPSVYCVLLGVFVRLAQFRLSSTLSVIVVVTCRCHGDVICSCLLAYDWSIVTHTLLLVWCVGCVQCKSPFVLCLNQLCKWVSYRECNRSYST